MKDFLVELVFTGQNVRHWRVTRGKAGAMVTVRESALYPGVYACLTCRSVECEHATVVREIDHTPSCVTEVAS